MLANFIKCEAFDASETGEVQHRTKIQKETFNVKTKPAISFKAFSPIWAHR